jgi:excisionase family DNA binding protein
VLNQPSIRDGAPETSSQPIPAERQSLRSHQAARSEILPSSLPPRGLCREVAAAYIGVGGSKFDQMIKEGVMPKPRIHGGRRLWDRSELDVAFSNLPHADEIAVANPWDDVRM